MTITIDLPERASETIAQIAKWRNIDAAAIAREVILERFPSDAPYVGLDNLEEALAKIDAMPGTAHRLDWNRMHTADFYEEQ